MSWKDPTAPWQRALRKRLRLQWVGLASVLVVALVPAALVLWLAQGLLGRESVFDSLMRFFVVPLLAVVAAGVWIVRRGRQDRALLDLVPAHDGHVCSQCRRALPVESTAGKCPGCGKEYAQPELREYWERYALQPRTIARGRIAGPGSWHDRMRTHPVVMSVMFVAVSLAGVLLLMRQMGGSTLFGIVETARMFVAIPMIALGAAMAAGSRQRVGWSEHCAKCDYARAPAGENPERCPECNTDWSQPGSIVRGRTPPRPGLRVAGILVLLVGAGLAATMYVPALQAGFYRVVPTSVLIAGAGEPYGGRDAIVTLLSRDLDAGQRDELARVLLQRREAQGALHDPGATWIEQRIATGEVSAEIVEEYYRGKVRLEIDAPEQAVIGKPFEVTVLCKHLSTSGVGVANDDFVVPSGFYIGDDPEPLGRPNHILYANLIDRDCAGGTAELPSGRTIELPHWRDAAPQIEYAATEAGPLRIRMVAWVLVGPAGQLNRRIEWQADGTFEVPAEVVWQERLELTHEVDVSGAR